MNRIIGPHSFAEMSKVLNKAEVSSQGVENMVPKGFSLPIRLTAVPLGGANIIKQEMLSVGADAAIARGVVEGIREQTDVILLGTVDKIRKVIRKLSHYTTFGLPQIRKDLDSLLTTYLSRFKHELKCRDYTLELSQTEIMGILNITPDSFSDGGDFTDRETAIAQALQMHEAGAVIIDIGGESTRPGASPVDEETEAERIIEIVSGIKAKKKEIILSVDTYKAKVALQALKAGADIINDISALRFDRDMVNILQDFPDVPVVLMHIQGTPATMQKNPRYGDVVDDILDFLSERIDFCQSAGIEKKRIIVDPGIGFGKTYEHNLEILRRLTEFHALGVPVMIGASRKGFINNIYSSRPKERLSGSLAVSAFAFQHKLSLVRVHDVQEQREFLQTLKTIQP
jgi:dihydropteroate synthase